MQKIEDKNFVKNSFEFKSTNEVIDKFNVMVFCFVQKFFFGQHKNSNIYFFCRAKREFLFQKLTLGYMTNTLNQIIIFFLHQNQNIFFSNIGNQNIFLEKNHTPPLEVKWSVPIHLSMMLIKAD